MTHLFKHIATLSIAIFSCSQCFAAVKTITVATDGSGDYKTLQEAIAATPDKSTDRTIIHLKPGTYQGQIVLPASKNNVTFEGDDAAKTILTYAQNVKDPLPEGALPQFNGTGVIILGSDFKASKVTFQNTSGDHGQALALRIDGDRAILQDCRMLGWQDTLMVNTGRQYFHKCYIEGRVDFIYGSATTVFDNCEIHSKNGGHITAANTPQDHPYGFVFMNCHLTGDPAPWPNPDTPPNAIGTKVPQADLGRPWRPFASVTYLNCTIDAHIKPEGWNNWRNPDNEKTARYAEYLSTGPGANPTQRVAWSKQLTKAEAEKITIASVLGGTDAWNPSVPKPTHEMALWPGNPPNMVVGATPGADDGTGRVRNVGIPGMLVYLPETSPMATKKIALIVCPGGGYTHLTRLAGADGAVNTFRPLDIAVISLKYRLTPPSTQVETDSLADVQQAVQIVRSHAKEWGIDANKIGVLGWSAGANVALNLATHFDKSSRPDFVVLLSPWPDSKTIDAYPAIKNSPPAFIASAKDDKTAPVTFAEQIADSYKKAHANASLWIVETGGHGAFTIDAPGEGGQWVQRFLPWLESIHMRKS